MTTAFRSVLLFSLLCFLTVGVAWGQDQNTDLAGSQFTQSFGVDSINLQNLNVNIDVPILQKPGAIPFSFETAGESNCVIVGTAPNRHVYCGIGFRKVDIPGGNLDIRMSSLPYTNAWSISGTKTTAACTADGGTKTTWTNVSVQAPDLTTYLLPTADSFVTESGGTACVSNLNDYTLYGGMHVVTNNTATTVTPPNGYVYSFGSGLVNTQDPFGNTISYNSSTQNITDTLGNAALNLGTANTWTYHDTGGTAQNITQVLSASQTIKTTFGCSGIGDQTYSGNVVNEIDYPDGNNLLFTYEAVTGGITGRIYQITYRTGGTAAYTYGSIDCTTMMPTSITRTTVDGATTYTRAVITGGSTTTVLDPGKNKTVYTFQGGGSNVPLTLTQVQTYQNTGTVASPSYTLLSRVLYCYNGNATSCDTTQAAYPITEKDTYVLYGSMVVNSRVKQLFDSYGNVTESDSYDFGASSPTLKTSITYGSWNGSTCAAVGSSIVNLPCEVKTTDNATPANTISDVRHTYGTKGFETTTSVWSGSQWFATRVALANSNGTPQYVRNSLGTQTNYSYAATGSGGCNAMLPTGTSVTVGSATLTTGATWDCNMGKLLSSTDANSHTANFTYDLLGRPASQQDPANLYTLTESYPSATSSTLTDSTYFTTTLTVDGLGRPIRSQTTDGASYDTASTAYAFTTGTNPQWQVSASQPCIATLGADCTLNHFGKADPLGRSISSSTTSNETTATVYYGDATHSVVDVQTTVSPAPNGENNKVVQTEYDGLGRVKSTCAIQTTGGTSCGQAMSGSGIKTSFTYTYAAGQTTVAATRGSQVHTTVYDALGRATSVTIPEGGSTLATSGTTTYIYDQASASCSSGTAPGYLLEIVDNAGVHTCQGYDAIGRPTNTFVAGTSNPCRVLVYGDQYSGTPTVTNANGRLAEAWTDSNCTGSSKITDEYFSYDADGRMLDAWETTPNSGGQYHTQASYAVNGVLASISGVPGKLTYTITPDTNGRPDSSKYGTNVVGSNVVYNGAGQPTEIDYQSTDKDTYSYDSNTGLMTGWTTKVGTPTLAATLTWNPNRTLKTLAITDGFNAGGTQTCHYNPTDAAGSGYDDVGRLVGANCGATYTETYAYDQYNNITKSGSFNWAPGYGSTNNHINPPAAYDSDGQVTYDKNNSFAWDGYHKMSIANSGAVLGSCGGAGVTCVTYDALGRPVEKNIGGTITEMLYSPVGLTGIMSRQTTNRMRVPIPGGSIFDVNSVGWTIDHLDYLGSARIVSTLTGHAATTDQAYSPYGEGYASFGTSGFLNFTGDFQDLYSGLYDTPNREFDASSGSRWLTPDPARASWNAYSYPLNPNSMTDPSGLDGIDSVSPKRGLLGDVTQQVASYSYPVYSPWSVDPLNLMGSIPGVLTLHSTWTTSVDLGNGFVPSFTNYSYTMSNGTSFINMSSGMPVGNGLVMTTGPSLNPVRKDNTQKGHYQRKGPYKNIVPTWIMLMLAHQPTPAEWTMYYQTVGDTVASIDQQIAADRAILIDYLIAEEESANSYDVGRLLDALMGTYAGGTAAVAGGGVLDIAVTGGLTGGAAGAMLMVTTPCAGGMCTPRGPDGSEWMGVQ